MWEVIIRDANFKGARRCYFSTRHAAEFRAAKFQDTTIKGWTP
jgi:hypothetical protein